MLVLIWEEIWWYIIFQASPSFFYENELLYFFLSPTLVTWWKLQLSHCRCFIQVAYFISELKSPGEDSAEGTTFKPSLSSPAVPSPWSSPRKVESPHPLRDDYQCCKTVVLPGASCLYIEFDPRCATQYDYDKVRHVRVTIMGCPLLCPHNKCFWKRKMAGLAKVQVWRQGKKDEGSTEFASFPQVER